VLPIVWDRNPDEGQRNLVKLRQLVRGALAEMRTLLFELRPDSLLAAELSTLLGHLRDSLTGRAHIPVSYQIEGDFSPPTEVKVAFYRIAQEAFNNITKYSNATQVNVELLSKKEGIKMSIQDNGRGFDRTEVAEDRMGHQIMSERAREINAKFELKSSPGNGTLVSIVWPEEKLGDDKN
jgi:signal transduction histidine kinase